MLQKGTESGHSLTHAFAGALPQAIPAMLNMQHAFLESCPLTLPHVG